MFCGLDLRLNDWQLYTLFQILFDLTFKKLPESWLNVCRRLFQGGKNYSEFQSADLPEVGKTIEFLKLISGLWARIAEFWIGNHSSAEYIIL